MKLGVLTNVVGNMPLEDALKYFKSMGIQMVEIGCGGYPGKDHCDPEVLLHDEAKYQEFCDTIKKYDMEVSENVPGHMRLTEKPHSAHESRESHGFSNKAVPR